MQRLEQLSLAALRTTAQGAVTDRAVVAQRLYRFGTTPRTAAVERDLGPEDDPLGVLGLCTGGAARRRLDREYVPTVITGWCAFTRLPLDAEAVTACKLYVSPRCEAIGDAFHRVVDVFAASGVRSFKVGRGIEGLLRPDKIVAYFDDPAHLHAVARALAARLSRTPPQGTPFTCPIDAAGLLSWGVDPPPGRTPASWRAWITRYLADGLVARAPLPAAQRVSGVLADLAVAGVDATTWLPRASTFDREVAA